jgi:hypothetical protein
MKSLSVPWARKSSKEETELLEEAHSPYDILIFSNDLPGPTITEQTSWSWRTGRGDSSIFQGWRYGIAICSILAATIFTINIAVLGWSVNNFKSNGGVVDIFNGDCGHAKTLSTWLHLGINILSTLLLGASNYCMQCLSAPTRESIDKAHSRGKWLSVGVPNFKNLFYIGWKKAALWWLLATSSVPLHLL